MCELCSLKMDGGSLLGYKFKCGLTNASHFKSWGIFTKHHLVHTHCHQETIKQQGTFSVGDQSQDCNSSLVKTRETPSSIMQRTVPEGTKIVSVNWRDSFRDIQPSLHLLIEKLCSRTGNVRFLLHLSYVPGVPIALCIFGQVSVWVLPSSLRRI